MSWERKEISAISFYIRLHMRSWLSAVDNYHATVLMNQFSSFLNRISYAKNIGDKSHSNKLGLFGNSLFKHFLCNGPIFFGLYKFQHCSRFPANHLPRKYVAVMLHDGYEYLIALFKKLQPVGKSDKIESLCRIPYKYYLRRVIRTDKCCCLCSGIFICICCFYAPLIQSS